MESIGHVEVDIWVDICKEQKAVFEAKAGVASGHRGEKIKQFF